MESLGEYLKREREFRNISLEEVSRKTKIRERILRDLEENPLDSLASPVFIKGYLRAYAGYVGLDPTDVVLRYEASLREEKEPPVRKPAEGTPQHWSLRYIVLPVSILLLLGILLFSVLNRPVKVRTNKEPKKTGERVSIPAPQTESTQPTAGETEGSSILPQASRKAVRLGPPPIHPSRHAGSSTSESPPGIELTLRAVEDTWIQIQIDEGSAKEIFLRPGEVLSRHGERNVEIKVGNAGGLEILHNGRELGKLGESGKVVYLSVSPEKVEVRKSSGLVPERP